MKKSNKAGRYNRFVQEPDESMFIIDGKKNLWILYLWIKKKRNLLSIQTR